MVMDDTRLLIRVEWKANPKSLSPYNMKLPAVGVHLHHSVTMFDDDGSYHSTADVAADMKEIERIGMQRFGRYSYSYNGHPSGIIGEGQGTRIGAHTGGYNSTTFGYCFIGNYENDPLTNEQVEAFGIWWRWAVNYGLLLPTAYVKFHRDRKATSCPGKNVVNGIDRLLTATKAPVPPTLVKRKKVDDMFTAIQQTTGNIWLFEEGRRTLLPKNVFPQIWKSGVYHFGEVDDDFFNLLITNRERVQ